MTKLLDGKSALVTGGSRGIGTAIATRLAADGATVTLTYGASKDAAEAVVRAIEKDGSTARAIPLDVRERGASAAVVANTADAQGGLDILVANAGVFAMTPLTETDDAAYDAMFDVNVRAVVEAARAAAERMTFGGRIIVTSSINADSLFVPGLGLYGASKAAISAFVRGWSRDLGPKGITINAIHPGPIDTDMNPEASEFATQLHQMMAVGRHGRPEEIAALAAFLAGPEAAFITGARMVIDGGLTA